MTALFSTTISFHTGAKAVIRFFLHPCSEVFPTDRNKRKRRLFACGRHRIVVFAAERSAGAEASAACARKSIAAFARFDIDAQDICMSCVMDKVKERTLARKE